MKRPLGVILHRGTSPWADFGYVVIAVFNSSNRKTGGMIQTYILRDGLAPVDAVQDGSDTAICGDCPMAGFIAKLAKRDKKTGRDSKRVRGCYVNVGQGPNMVFGAFMRGRYPEYIPFMHDQYFFGRKVRWGTYGEPVLIPLSIVEHISGVSDGWAGYTHQFAKPEFQGYRGYFMASVHARKGPQSAEHADHLGWRWFRTSRNGEGPGPDEVLCPASEEAGKIRTCETCGKKPACSGALGNAKRRSIYIDTHGGIGNRAALKIIQHIDA